MENDILVYESCHAFGEFVLFCAVGYRANCARLPPPSRIMLVFVLLKRRVVVAPRPVHVSDVVKLCYDYSMQTHGAVTKGKDAVLAQVDGRGVINENVDPISHYRYWCPA